MSIRILIAEDHGLVRAGLRALLSAEPDLEVVGEAANGQQALELAGQLQPDIVLLDLNMPELDGIGVTRRLAKLSPQSRALIITVHEDESLLQETIKVGAAGYIVKRAVESELIDAIRAVQRGDLYVHPTMTRGLLKRRQSAPPSPEPPLEALTPREIDVLKLIAQGHTNRQTAEQLSLSVRTVEGYRANLMHKLGLQGRVELVSYARKNKLVS